MEEMSTGIKSLNTGAMELSELALVTKASIQKISSIAGHVKNFNYFQN
jgi:hypothetical protein